MKRAFLRWILAVLVTLVALEGVARVLELFWPPLPVDYGLGFTAESRVFTDTGGGMMETRPEKHRFFPRQRFPAARPAGRLRLAAVGGSSVNRLEEDLRQLADELAGALPAYDSADVIVAGGHSYGTDRLIGVLAEILDYDPSLVIIYTGHNEFESVEQRKLAGLENLWLQKALGSLALGRMIRDLVVSMRVSQLQEEHAGRTAGEPQPARAWRHQFTDEEVAERMEAFERNLRLMVALCREHDVPVVIGTVATNVLEPYLPEPAFSQYGAVRQLFAAGRWAEGYALGRKILAGAIGRHQASDTENAIIARVAAGLDVPLFRMPEAVAAAEPDGVPGQTLFDDHCHLNVRGNDLWRETVAPLALDALK